MRILVNFDSATNASVLGSRKAVFPNFSHPFVAADDDIYLMAPTAITTVLFTVFVGMADENVPEFLTISGQLAIISCGFDVKWMYAHHGNGIIHNRAVSQIASRK